MTLIQLREDYTPAQPLKVDRERGIIFGVKVLGVDSRNTHGKPVDGTDYLPSAHRSLVGILESTAGGLRVNKNHTEPQRRNRDRTVAERIGWLENPRMQGDETFADLHLLKADPDSAKLFEAAERNPRCFALSINADGHYEITGRRLRIDRFERVDSVDVVTDGGSTVSLAESNRTQPRRKGRRPMKLQEALEAIKLDKKAITRLYEMGDGTMLKPDMAADAEPEAPAEDDGDYCLHLGKAIVAILNDGEMQQDEKKKKILGILKLTDEEGSEGETPTEESDEDKGEKEEKDDDDKEDKKPVKESLQRKVQRLEREHEVTTLCESLKFTPTAIQRKALVAVSESADRKALAEEFKGKPEASPAKKGTGPVRSSAGSTRVQESAELPKDAADQAKRLLIAG